MKKISTICFVLFISFFFADAIFIKNVQAQSTLNVKVLGSGNSYACLPAYPKTGKTIVFYVQNLPAGAGQCSWIAPASWKQVSNTGARLDTIAFNFIPDSLPKGGELFVSFDNNNYEGIIRYNVVNKAKEYTAKIIADQPVACLGNILRYSIYPHDDSNYNTFRTNPAMDDDAGMLKYYWSYDNDINKDAFIEETRDPYIETSLSEPITKLYVTTRTCEPSITMVPAARKFSLDINYIANPPYPAQPAKPQIEKIIYTTSESAAPAWTVDNSLPVCVHYDRLPPNVGKKNINSDGYVRVQMNVPNTAYGDSLKKYLVYIWMYDPAQLKIVSDSVSKTRPTMYGAEGFVSSKYGDSSYRAIFKVLEKDTGKTITLKAFAFCPDCRNDNRFFSTDTAKIIFNLIDTVVLDGYEFRVDGPSNACELAQISYTTTTLYRGSNSNVTEYVWDPSTFFVYGGAYSAFGNSFSCTADTIRNKTLIHEKRFLITQPATACFYKHLINGDTNGIIITPVTIRKKPKTPVLQDLLGKTYHSFDTLNICSNTSFIETLSLHQPFDSLSGNYFSFTQGSIHNTVVLPPGAIKIPGRADSATFQIRSDGSPWGSIGELSISSENICGTSTVPLVIATRTIDTVSNAVIVDKLGNDILDFSTVFRLCKDSLTTYSVKDIFDFVDEYTWKIPSGWTQTSAPPYSSIFVTIGESNKKTDTISLQTRNKCGFSKKSVILIDPIHPRHPITWTSKYDTLCQHQTVTYSFKAVKDASWYNVRFPEGWIIDGTFPESNTGIFDTMNTDFFDPVTRDLKVNLTAPNSGHDSRGIICNNDACGKTYRESFKTFSNPTLPAPIKAGVWPAEICQIAPSTTPIVKLRVNTSHFPSTSSYTLKWELPSGCTQAQYYSNGDSIRILTTSTFDDSVKVFGLINGCANNEVVSSDTLKIHLIARDTISSSTIVFEDGYGNPFNANVCANAPLTIEAIAPLGVEKFIWSYPGQGMSASKKWVISPNDSSGSVQFIIDSSANRRIGVRAKNVCGTSKVVKYTDTIHPMYIHPFQRLQPWKSAICTGSSTERTYSFKALPYITHYNISFPSDWSFKDESTNVKTFTNNDAIGDSISFVAIPGTDTGYLLIEVELIDCNTKYIDSTKLQKIATPHKPVLVSTISPKACAGDTITFIAKTSSLDVAISNISFKWVYNQTIFTKVRENIIGDTRYLTLRPNRPLPPNKNTIVSAYTWRDDCDDIVYSPDSLHISVYLMDTVSLAGHKLISPDQLIELSKDPCDGDILRFADTVRNADIEKYKWAYPNDWSAVSRDTLAEIILKTGGEKGFVAVQAQNKCGLSAPLTYPRLINPISIKKLKKAEANWDPAMCPNGKETRTYIFKIQDFGDLYHVKFPDDWVIKSTGTFTADFTNSQAGTDSLIRFEVETGFDTGYIIVSITNNLCSDTKYDSTKIYKWREAKRPISATSWPAKLCIGSVVNLSVTSDPSDYGAPLFYEWFLPSQFTPASPIRPAADTTSQQINFKVNGILNPNDRFGVVAKRKDCGGTWKYSTDTLWYNFLTLDTAVIPSGITLLDNGVIADLTPCEDNNVNYTFDISGFSPGYIDRFLIRWNGIDTVPPGDTLKGQWLFTNKNSLPDHLEMIVGKEPLQLTVQPQNYCGTSKATSSIIINPYIKPEVITWRDSSSNLCEQSTNVIFSVDTIKGASFYAWELPFDWIGSKGSYLDTSYNMSSSGTSGINIKTGSQSGLVSVIAQIGHCFTTSSSLSFSLNPAPLPPVYDGVWDDSLKICKSSNLILKVKPNPLETNPGISFRWVFPSNDWNIITSNADFSEIEVTIGSRKYITDSIRVITNSATCSNSEGGMLKLPITIWGQEYLTLPDSAFFDAVISQPLDLIPCQAGQVKYYVNRDLADPSVDSICWVIGNSDTLPDNGILDNGWLVNDALSFPNHLDLIAGTDSFLLKAYAKNSCGIGNTTVINIKPGTLITGKTIITPDVSSYCLNDTVILTAALTDGRASKYMWHHPWKPKIDTTSGTTLTLKIGPAAGKIWVVPANGCGPGTLFDSLDAVPLLDPYKPYYVNEEGTIIRSNNITDTFCKNDKHVIYALKNDADISNNITFIWSYTNPPGAIPPGRVVQHTDSLIINSFSGLAINQFKATVQPKHVECRTAAADSAIEIWINLVDTVSIENLGSIIDISGSALHKQPCPGDTMHVKVEHNLARAYKWFLPDNSWHFANSDTTNAAIKIIAGATSGEIKVVTRTANDDKYCGADLVNTVSLKSATIHPNKTWNIIDWPGFQNSVCEGQAITVSALSDATNEDDITEKNSPSLIDGFKWIFPRGWVVTSTNAVQINDSTFKTPTGECNVIAGSSSGAIKSCVVTKCNNGIDGNWASKSIGIIMKAHVTLNGEMRPCADSNIVLNIRRANREDVFTMTYFTNIAAPYEPNFNSDSSRVSFPPLKLGDSLLIQIEAFNQCGTGFTEIYTIKADTIPTITGYIDGWANPCDLTTHIYKAIVTNSNYDIKFEWSLPRIWNDNVLNDTTIEIFFRSFGSTLTDSILAYPVTACGSGNPFVMHLTVASPDVFNASLSIENTTKPGSTDICEEDILKVNIIENETVIPTLGADIFRWNIPADWIIISDSTDAEILVKTGKKHGIITVQRLTQNSCGYSRSITHPSALIKPQLLPAKPVFTTEPYPCNNATDVRFEIANDTNIASVAFHIDPAISFIQDTINAPYFIEIGNVGTVPFNIFVECSNGCGTRDSNYLITPVAALSPFSGTIKHERFCAFDTVKVLTDITNDYIVNHANFNWSYPSGWQLVKEVVSAMDNTAAIYIIPNNEAEGTITVESSNACGVPTNSSTPITAKPIVLTLEAAAIPANVNFKETTVLELNKIERKPIAPVSLDEFDFEWTPIDKISGTNTGHDTKITKELLHPVELFTLTATETNVIRPISEYGLKSCKVATTVPVNVDGTLDAAIDGEKYICKGNNTVLTATTVGGDTTADASFAFKWYIFDTLNQKYYLLGKGDEISINNKALNHSNEIMLIASNNFALASYGEVKIYDTAYFNIIVGDSVFPKITSPLYKDVNIKIGEKIAFKTIVNGGYGSELVWYPAELFEEGENTGYTPHTKMLLAPGTIHVFSTDSVSGCVGHDSIIVKTNYDFGSIPNAFTPNGDGVNDVFMPGVDLEVYTRWEQLLFKSSNKEGWNGKINGKVVKKGEYLYIIKIKDENGVVHSKSGFITVLE